MTQKEYRNQATEKKAFTTPFHEADFGSFLTTQSRIFDVVRYNTYQAEHDAAFGVFELPEGAVLRHHDEAWLTELLSPFEKQEFEHLRFRTMNGNDSNGLYYTGKKWNGWY